MDQKRFFKVCLSPIINHKRILFEAELSIPIRIAAFEIEIRGLDEAADAADVGRVPKLGLGLGMNVVPAGGSSLGKSFEGATVLVGTGDGSSNMCVEEHIVGGGSRRRVVNKDADVRSFGEDSPEE